MPAPPNAASWAVARQLACALEEYDLDTDEMIEAWPDLDRYQVMSDQVERVRMYSEALPQVRVEWSRLLIAHSELVHRLWQSHYGRAPVAAGGMFVVRERHADCLRALRLRCQQLQVRRG